MIEPTTTYEDALQDARDAAMTITGEDVRAHRDHAETVARRGTSALTPDCPMCWADRRTEQRRRVWRGAAWLDEHFPEWPDSVDPRQIDHDALKLYATTVIEMMAETYGPAEGYGWANALTVIFGAATYVEFERAEEMGMAADRHTVDPDGLARGLNAAWRDVIEVRRQGGRQ